MENEKLERVLRTVDPARRLFLKRFLFGATFAVPIVASYSVKNVAYAGTTSATTTGRSGRAREAVQPSSATAPAANTSV